MKYTLVSLYALIISAFLAQVSFAETVAYVQVKSAKLRSSAAPWAPSVATLSYGDEVRKIGGDDSWWQVKTGKGASGFLAASSVTDRKIVLSSSGKVSGSGVDTADVVMAGKGFNKAIEQSYAKNGNLDYKAVNKMEAIQIGESEQKRFAQEGKLSGGN